MRYDFRCEDCGLVFEAWARVESPMANCPTCLLPATKLFVPTAAICVKKHFSDFVRSELEPAKDDHEGWEAMSGVSQVHAERTSTFKEYVEKNGLG